MRKQELVFSKTFAMTPTISDIVDFLTVKFKNDIVDPRTVDAAPTEADGFYVKVQQLSESNLSALIGVCDQLEPCFSTGLDRNIAILNGIAFAREEIVSSKDEEEATHALLERRQKFAEYCRVRRVQRLTAKHLQFARETGFVELGEGNEEKQEDEESGEEQLEGQRSLEGSEEASEIDADYKVNQLHEGIDVLHAVPHSIGVEKDSVVTDHTSHLLKQLQGKLFSQTPLKTSSNEKFTTETNRCSN